MLENEGFKEILSKSSPFPHIHNLPQDPYVFQTLVNRLLIGILYTEIRVDLFKPIFLFLRQYRTFGPLETRLNKVILSVTLWVRK